MNADRSLFSLKPSENRDTKLFDAYVGVRDKNAGETYTAECRLPKNLKHKEELTL